MSYREFSDYSEWLAAAEDMGYQIFGPWADVENGPSADELYEPTMACDRIAGEEIGMWEEIEEGGYGILFDNPNGFAEWLHEGENIPENFI